MPLQIFKPSSVTEPCPMGLCFPLQPRGVVPGDAGDAMAPSDQLALSQPWGADYVHQILLALPDFQTFLRLCNQCKKSTKYQSHYAFFIVLHLLTDQR